MMRSDININCFSIFFALYPKAKAEVAISQIPPHFFNSDAKIEKMFCSILNMMLFIDSIRRIDNSYSKSARIKDHTSQTIIDI